MPLAPEAEKVHNFVTNVKPTAVITVSKKLLRASRKPTILLGKTDGLPNTRMVKHFAFIMIHMLQQTSKILLVRIKANENALLF